MNARPWSVTDRGRFLYSVRAFDRDIIMRPMRILPLLRKGFQNALKYKGVLLFVFVIGLGIFAAFHPAFADTAVTAPAAAPSTATQVYEGITNGPTVLMLNILTSILDYIVIGIGKLTLIILEMLIIPILNYNGFSTSPVIGLGWSLVRDVMNMFVVAALLFIAIFTIVGNHRAHWEQQLPQLFLAVIFMNFSRTICGILIDISQVIMFTFVNALLDIAAGNFAQLFQMQDFGKFSTTVINQSLTSGNAVLDPLSQFIQAFLQVPLYGAIFAILFLLALAFLYRIVLLWILVILSPMTFFLGGLRGVFGAAAGAAGNWWGKFTGALMMGPILTFFLWLALAAASSGSIAESEHFPVPQNPQSYGLSLTVFDSSHLTSLIIALILLTVGMQVAGEQSSKVGGIAAQAINEGMGNRVVSGALLAPFRAGAAAGRGALGAASYAGRKADIYGGQFAGTGTIREGIGKQIIGAGQLATESGFGGIGRTVASYGGAIELQGEHERVGRKKAAQERVGRMSDTEKATYLATLAQGKTSPLLSTREDYNAVSLDFMQNERVQAETKEHIEHGLAARGVSGEALEKQTDDAFNKQMQQVLRYAGEEKSKGRLDDAAKNKYTSLANKYVDLLDDPAKQVNDDKFNANDGRKRAEAIVNDARFEDAAKKKTLRTTKDGVEIKLWDEMAKGVYGQEYKNAIENKGVGKAFSNVNVANFSPANGHGDTLTKQIVDSEVNINSLGSSDANSQLQIKQEFINNVANRQDAPTITKALASDKVKPSEIPASAFAPGADSNQLNLVRGVMGANAVGGMDPAAITAFNNAAKDLLNQQKLSLNEFRSAQTELLKAKQDLANVIQGAAKTGNKVTLDDHARQELSEIFEKNARNFEFANEAMRNDPDESDVTALIANTASKKNLQDLAKELRGASDEQYQEIKDSMEAIHTALERENAAIGHTRTGVAPEPDAAHVRETLEESDRLRKLLKF